MIQELGIIFIRRRAFSLCLMILLMVMGAGLEYPPAVNAQTQEGIAVMRAGAESLNKSVEDTQKAVERIEDGVKQAKRVIKALRAQGKISKGDSLKLLQSISEAEYTLNQSKGPLKQHKKLYGKVTSEIVVGLELIDLHNAYSQHQKMLGESAGGLAALVKISEIFGDKIPILGQAIGMYTKATSKLLGNLKVVSKGVQKYRNQHAIGEGTYRSGTDRQKQEIFKRDFPQYAYQHTYLPTAPFYVYEAVSGNQPRYIWDERQQRFYPVASTIPIYQIYKDQLRLGRRVSPEKLKSFAHQWTTTGAKNAEKALILARIFSLHKDDDISSGIKAAVLKVRSQFPDELYLTAADPELFRANYIYNAYFRNQVIAALRQLYTNAAYDPYLRPFANSLFAMAKKQSIILAYVPPPKRTSPKKKVSSAQEREFRGRQICQVYMQALSKRHTKTGHDGSTYTVRYPRPFRYENGQCVGSSEIWRKKTDNSPAYAETRNGSPSRPMRYEAEAIYRYWKKIYPGLNWPSK